MMGAACAYLSTPRVVTEIRTDAAPSAWGHATETDSASSPDPDARSTDPSGISGGHVCPDPSGRIPSDLPGQNFLGL